MATTAIKRFPEIVVLLAMFTAVIPKMPIESSKRAIAAEPAVTNAQQTREDDD